MFTHNLNTSRASDPAFLARSIALTATPPRRMTRVLPPGASSTASFGGVGEGGRGRRGCWRPTVLLLTTSGSGAVGLDGVHVEKLLWDAIEGRLS